VGRLLFWSSGLMVANSLGYALAPAWSAMVGAGVLAGLGAGAIDAGINAFAAARFPARLVNWLHASYGLGAMLGPLLMTGVLGAGLSWRWGYAAISAMLAGMALCFRLTLGLWEVRAEPTGPGAAARSRPAAGLLETLGRPPVWLNIGLFFVYTGLEVTAGQWTYTLFTDGRGVPTGLAGFWISAYWGSLTAGRLVAGAVASRCSNERLLRWSMAGAPLAAAAVWLGGDGLTSMLGLAALGFLLAPIYPLLIAETPGRLGAQHAPQAIGLQVSAAYLGTAALPGSAGVAARALGLESIGPFLCATAVALLLLHEVALRWGPPPHPAPRLQPAREGEPLLP
jgi:fucose permease